MFVAKYLPVSSVPCKTTGRAASIAGSWIIKGVYSHSNKVQLGHVAPFSITQSEIIIAPGAGRLPCDDIMPFAKNRASQLGLTCYVNWLIWEFWLEQSLTFPLVEYLSDSYKKNRKVVEEVFNFHT